jgi:CheY-like chemotaxis protein
VTSPSPGASAHGPADTKDPLVLIVDDNGQNRKLARDVLHAAGFRTLEAEGGAEGIALAAEHVPDVILMDLRLPDMDGIDAARRLGAGRGRRGSRSSR